MSANSGNDGQGNVLLAFILGGLVVVVAALGFLMFNSHGLGHEHIAWISSAHR